MDTVSAFPDNKIVYCKCPACGAIRKKINRKFNIVKRGYERNGFARFFCVKCKIWFNEKTGESMKWLER